MNESISDTLLAALLTASLIIDLLITAARTGLNNIRYAQLLTRVERGETAASQTLEILEDRTRFNTAFKLSQTFLRMVMIALTLILLLPTGSISIEYWQLVLWLVGTAVVIWCIEFLIELFVSRDPETWALRITPLARIISYPFSLLVSLPLRIAREKGPQLSQTEAPTEDEILTLMNASQRDGLLEQDESKMIHSIFQMGDTLAREIMIPRMDMFTLDVDSVLEEVADEILESGYSRVPVFEEQIDNIIGMLYTKDMLKAWRTDDHSSSLRPLLRPANFIPEAKKIDELLAEMQSQRIHIAIVVDEYGGVAGLVTLEDIVEEIFGEILDEYDQGEELPYQQISDSEYIFRGRIDLDDFNELMGVNLEDADAETLGGFIYSSTGRVPKVGEEIKVNGILLTVAQISGRRIRKVRAVRTDHGQISNKHQHSSTNTLEIEEN